MSDHDSIEDPVNPKNPFHGSDLIEKIDTSKSKTETYYSDAMEIWIGIF